MGKLENRPGCARRRHWSARQKAAILAEADAPGVTTAEVAGRHDISVHQIYKWRRKARVEGAFPEPGCPSPFIELVSSGMRRGAVAGSLLPDLMIGLGKGRSLQVSSGIDPDRLRRLIRSIEQA